ncbi:retrovirus-related pol polyprotein from transposon TNT 1-94 [Tanacetum coccineum]|uniref:Retrovirus-related pol polyprotein from transposon TNT 1-94 n=1 Tax=Tanacetum coccineum TaxID=301880 RepID=A0ABQ5BG70_9ASTR
MALTVYADAYHAGCLDTRRSTFGSAQFLGDKLVSWSLKKQTSTSISSTKAEYIAMSGCYIMVNVNAPVEQAPAVAPPTRTDEQILPRIRWVPIGKSNCYLDAEKSQSSPIYKIVMDILKQTNFFRAFTASSTIPAIYIQQFWDTICYDRIFRGYKCQLDEKWFNLTTDTLRDALRITPVNNNKAFSSPPTQDTLINFINDLGYPKEVKHLSNVVTNDMFQPWRALTTIINLCLTGKTSGFERPRAPVFKHKFHPRPESPLHLPTEEPILGYLKFSAKGTKREVFGMPILNELITDDIRGAYYYDAYLEKVAKHQRYIAGEEVSDPDSPAKSTKPKVTKQAKPATPKAATKKPQPALTKPKVTKQAKPAAPKAATKKPQPAPTKPKVTKQAKPVAPKVATKEPQPAPTKPKEKKRKQAKETTEATPLAKRAKSRKVADTQRAIEESLKDVHGAPRGPLPFVVFRETDTGKYQPLPEVEGKGKEKVSVEQVAQVLLNLQTPKKKSPDEQYIFQRRTSTPTEPSGHDESSSLYAELGFSNSDTESDEEVPPIVKSGAQDEGQAGPNPGKQDEGQTGRNPGNDTVS